MRELVSFELFVGLTPSMRAALEIATQFSGMKSSTWARQAILEKLVREKFIAHPLQVLAEAQNAQAAQEKANAG